LILAANAQETKGQRLPIIDMHLHAHTLSMYGTPPPAVCTNDQGIVFPGWDPRQPLRLVLLEYDLPDATGSAIRAEMKRIKPKVPVLLFNGVGSETPFLLRFFDSYLRNFGRPEGVFEELEN
jgi:hypothetical protein